MNVIVLTEMIWSEMVSLSFKPKEESILFFNLGINIQYVDLHFSDSIINNAALSLYFVIFHVQRKCSVRIKRCWRISFHFKRAYSVHSAQLFRFHLKFFESFVIRNQTLNIQHTWHIVCVCNVYIPVNQFHVIWSTKEKT